MDSLILAAGKGTRMKSDLPKVIFEIAGRPMLFWVLNSLKKCEVSINNIMLGYRSELISEEISKYYDNIDIYLQKEQLGTGHAVKTFVNECDHEFSSLMVLCGDTPLLDSDELKAFCENHKKENNVISVMTAYKENSTGYGRIVKENDLLKKIVEEKDADEEQKKIREVNSGIYIFDGKFLRENINSLNNDNAQGEFYLTDLIEMAVSQGKKTGAFSGKLENIMGVNDIRTLSVARKMIHERINNDFMDRGVDIYDPESVFIDFGVKIEGDTRINPFTTLKGESIIRKGSVVGPYSFVKDCEISGNVTMSHIEGAVVENNVNVGPFSRLRQGALVKKGSRVGNFVEIKKSILEEGVKAGHLSYIGDSIIGEETNIGAGTITCNYDGEKKSQTIIGKKAFIGSNTALVAPVEIGDNALIAAGSTVTKNVPENALAFGRAKQINKTNFNRRK